MIQKKEFKYDSIKKYNVRIGDEIIIETASILEPYEVREVYFLNVRWYVMELMTKIGIAVGVLGLLFIILSNEYMRLKYGDKYF